MGQYFFRKKDIAELRKNHTVLSHEPAYSQNSILVTTLVIRKTQWRTQGEARRPWPPPLASDTEVGPRGPLGCLKKSNVQALISSTGPFIYPGHIRPGSSRSPEGPLVI